MCFNYKKKTVECDCGCKYGTNCGRKTCFMFKYSRTTDTGDLYIKDIAPNTENEDSQPYQYIRTFNDNDIAALSEILQGGESSEEISKNDKLT